MDIKGILNQALEVADVVYVGDDREVSVFAFLEEQKRQVGPAYQAANDVRHHSKIGMVALKESNYALLALCAQRIGENMATLRRLNLPADLLWQHIGEAGQEAGEFMLVRELHELLFPRGMVPSGSEPFEGGMNIPSATDLCLEPQAWLAALIDATSELGKLAVERMCRGDMTRAQHVATLRRMLEIARTVYGYLQKFEGAVPMIINNSRRRGYGNTFRGAMYRIERLIENNELALLRMVQDDSK